MCTFLLDPLQLLCQLFKVRCEGSYKRSLGCRYRKEHLSDHFVVPVPLGFAAC